MSALRKLEAFVVLPPLRVAFGGVMLFAAYQKLFSGLVLAFPAGPVWNFADSIAAYDILDKHTNEHLIVTAAYTLPWLEAIAGILLVVGLWARPAALLSAAMMGVFTLANLSIILRQMDVSCSCFGDFEWPCSGSVGWCQVGRNAALLGVAALLAWRGAGALSFDARTEETRAAEDWLDEHVKDA